MVANRQSWSVRKITIKDPLRSVIFNTSLTPVVPDGFEGQ